MKFPKGYALGLLLVFGLPFVLQKDLYPLFRFGMFAEPIHAHSHQQEYFKLYLVAGNSTQRLDQHAWGFTESNWAYLIRNHVYRKEASKMLDILHKTKALPPGTSLELYCFAHAQDSTLIAQSP